MAAQGEFIYTEPSEPRVLPDPEATCYPYLGADGLARNETDQVVELFDENNCSGIPQHMAPRDHREVAFKSLRFHHRARGDFEYTVPGKQKSKYDPSDNHCYDIAGQGYTANLTNRDVLLYPRAGCVGSSYALRRHETTRGADFQSMEFVN